MNKTVEYNQGFYHALNPKSKIQECPYIDEERSTRWIEGYYEGLEASTSGTAIRGMD